ncbi:MAG: MFS transporter [Verrucomicrobia bacterium]|nr:MAG: MFS transporter [Verrucomicrobiota bacterium]
MTSERPKRENLLVNLACNLVAPALILSKLSTDERLGPVWALILALAFPISYGIWDFFARGKFNFIAGIGFASTLLTGGFALAELDGFWFAVKEASVPLAIGLMVLLSMNSKRPLVREFIYNDQVIDVPKVDAILAERSARPAFDRLLAQAGWLIAASFAVSAFLNFFLARWILTASSGTPEFTAQLGKMQWLSWPVITIPTMAMMMFALWQLLKGIKALTGLELDDLLQAPPEKSKPN